jgi:hypothetical protein
VRSEVLEKHPDANIMVYAVWFRNLWSDFRFMWRSKTLDDPRVVNFWDSEKVAGRWYATNVTHRGPSVEWDAWFLYAPGIGFSVPPSGMGRTIMGTRESLRAAIDKSLQASTEKARLRRDGREELQENSLSLQ